MIEGKPRDKDALRRVLQPLRDWQRDYAVQIYLGEFSAIRWAPEDSAYRYLRDCIELFEEFGWDWSYHASANGAAGVWNMARTKPTPSRARRKPDVRNCFASFTARM